MYCSKCGNEIKEEEQFCSKCGTAVGNAKEKSIKSKKSIIIAVVCIVALIVIICLVKNNSKTVETGSSDGGLFGIGQKEDEGFIQTSANVQANGTQFLSFNNMSADDEGLNEIQQDIINYFDNDYFYLNVENSKRYPQVFKGAKVRDYISVVKILKSDDEEFEIVVGQADEYGGYQYEGTSIENIPENELYIIKGKQLEQRLLKDDKANIFGRYEDVSTVEIDGRTYTLPVVNSLDIIKDTGYIKDENYSTVLEESNLRHSLSRIKNVAEYIFGKDIKISQPIVNEDFGSDEYYNELEFYMPFYLVTLDNQSNVNFKSFDFFREEGMIIYNQVHNNISKGTSKKLYISADFQHYIVTTYDSNLQHVYIDYFDKELKKEWSREFDYNSTKAFASPMDYTSDKMAIVVDNDLYLLDLKTGENIIEPVIVGEKLKVNMMSDGIVLIGDDNKDTIMKVGYDGKILFRQNADTQMSDFDVDTQIVNGKMVIKLQGGIRVPETVAGVLTEGYRSIYKYIVLNDDGTIEVSTDDLN